MVLKAKTIAMSTKCRWVIAYIQKTKISTEKLLIKNKIMEKQQPQEL